MRILYDYIAEMLAGMSLKANRGKVLAVSGEQPLKSRCNALWPRDNGDLASNGQLSPQYTLALLRIACSRLRDRHLRDWT